MSDDLVAVPGPGPLPAGQPVGYPNPSGGIAVKLVLRRQLPPVETTAAFNDLLSLPPHLRRYPTHAEVAAATGSYPDDVAALTTYFAPFGVSVNSSSLLLGTVGLTGSVAAFEQAFHTELALFQEPGQRAVLAARSGFQLPASLLAVVERVVLPQALVRQESRRPTRPTPPPPAGQAAAPALPGYGIQELAQAYQFPAGATGAGQVIGIVELGGKLNQNDVKQFFTLNGLKRPRIVEVGTVPPSPVGSELLNNAEVALDIQVAGALAPQALLVVYYGTTLMEALQAAVSDEANRPTVLSISWAGPESNYSPAEVQEFNLLLYQASLLGITVVAASADKGAYNGANQPNVSLPASNPLVLGCGGTTATLDQGKLTEIVWNESTATRVAASGGGYSALYAQPYYQAQAVARYPYPLLRGLTRGVPDVAANASDLHGYRVVFGGQVTAIGGTSGATPFVAALLALLGGQLGYRLGYLNTVLYGFAGSDAFRAITVGNNPLYPAAAYWNPCTGLGSLAGSRLLSLLQLLDQAGKPGAAAPAEAAAPAGPDPAAGAPPAPGQPA